MGRALLGLFAVPLVLCEIAYLSGERFTAWALVNVAIYPLITLASVALHEGGHLLAARAFGLQVPRVQLGLGRQLQRRRWAQTTVTVHVLPLAGMTYVGGKSSWGVRWPYWAAVAAGPAVTLAIVLGLVAGHGGGSLGELFLPIAAIASRPAPLEMAAFANASMLFWNLLPLPLFRGRGIERNDGAQLLAVPFWPARRLELLEITPGIVDAEERRERGDHEGAADVLDGLHRRFPDSWAVLHSMAIIQMERGRLAEARSSLVALLGTEPPLPEMRWAVRNNLAWVDYRLRDDDLRAEADEHSAAVLKRYKRVGWALGTRGAVLGWLGRHSEAIPLLERAYLLNSTARNRALNAASLTVVLAGSGQASQAAVWLERARTNDAGCPLLPEAEAALAALR